MLTVDPRSGLMVRRKYDQTVPGPSIVQGVCSCGTRATPTGWPVKLQLTWKFVSLGVSQVIGHPQIVQNESFFSNQPIISTSLMYLIGDPYQPPCRNSALCLESLHHATACCVSVGIRSYLWRPSHRWRIMMLGSPASKHEATTHGKPGMDAEKSKAIILLTRKAVVMNSLQRLFAQWPHLLCMWFRLSIKGWTSICSYTTLLQGTESADPTIPVCSLAMNPGQVKASLCAQGTIWLHG